MTIKTCKFRIGDVYLFHATDPGCESGTSLWGIVNDRDTDGRICLETSSADLKKYNHWTFLPAEYLFCRLSTREELDLLVKTGAETPQKQENATL